VQHQQRNGQQRWQQQQQEGCALDNKDSDKGVLLTVTTRVGGNKQQSATTRDAQAPKLKEMRCSIAAGHVVLSRGRGGKEGGAQGKNAGVGHCWLKSGTGIELALESRASIKGM
jgi:hypothetical protein